MTPSSSYAQILKSSSIMGGAAAINLLLSMVRTKFSAVLIGTTGIGLLANFTAIQGIVGGIAGLGIQSSAVRELSVAVGKGDDQAIGRAVLALRRLCWLTGIAGMVAMMLLSPLLSELTFHHRGYAPDIAALGFIILFTNLSGGQTALIQGMCRIGDMARANVYGAAIGAIVAIGFYLTLGVRGIVPALVTVAAVQLALSWHFARQVPVPQVTLTWRQTFVEANSMIKLGLVMMWNGFLGSAVTYAAVVLITQSEGIQAVGLYSAAFALSGMFVNFVLGAMAADYYPRLTSMSGDKAAMNNMINGQTEVGLLLALPGLLATMALAPWILQIFYTSEFLGAADLIQWFILGCLGRVISWPLGFVMLALGKGSWFLFTETSFNLLHVGLIALGLRLYGIEGVAVAFFVLYVGYILAVYLVAWYLIDFQWSKACNRLYLSALPVLVAVFVVVRFLPLWPATLLGMVFTFVTGVMCVRGLVLRVGFDHRIIRSFVKLPGGRFLLGRPLNSEIL